jgi:hypothetical protein
MSLRKQPARPINTPMDQVTARGRRTLDHVKHTVVAVIDALSHARAVECSRVTRLAAASRIKRSAVEHDRGPTTDAIGDVNNACVELDQMRVGII